MRLGGSILMTCEGLIELASSIQAGQTSHASSLTGRLVSRRSGNSAQPWRRPPWPPRPLLLPWRVRVYVSSRRWVETERSKTEDVCVGASVVRVIVVRAVPGAHENWRCSKVSPRTTYLKVGHNLKLVIGPATLCEGHVH